MQEDWGPPLPQLRSIQSRWTQAGTLIGDEIKLIHEHAMKMMLNMDSYDKDHS